MSFSVPQLYQPRRLMDSVQQGNALLQGMMQTQAMPQQIKNSLALQGAQAQVAQNEANYGSGQYGQILTALNNPNITPNQQSALNNAFVINTLAPPGMASTPTMQAVQASILSNDPDLSKAIKDATGYTPQELYKQQNEQYQSKTNVNEAHAGEAIQKAEYYGKGGAKGSFIDYLMKNPELSGIISPEMLAQGVGATLTIGAPPAVKAQSAANIALKYGNTALADSLDKWNSKSSTTSAILNKLSGYDMIDKGMGSVMPQYLPIMQYYSGPEGVAKLKSDILTASMGGTPSAEYNQYKTFTTTVLPSIADQLRKTWGNSISPEMNEQLQGIVGFKNSWDQIQQNPQIVMDRWNALQQLLGAEVSALKDYSAPSLIGNTAGAKGSSSESATDRKLQKELSGITQTMQNQESAQQPKVLNYNPSTGKWS